MITDIRKKFNDISGLAAVTVILITAFIVTALIIIIVPSYEQHRSDVNMTFDVETVATAKDVASSVYLLSSTGKTVTYYYDEVSHKCLTRDQIDTIVPYGRSSAKQNRKSETGAAGIPNLGDNGGAQLLAVTIEDGTVLMRWTGKKQTYYDYTLMDDNERDQLTEEDKREMDTDSAKKAVNAAALQYNKDYRRQLKKKTDPGTAVYDYDIFTDSVIYDRSMDSLEGAADIPDSTTIGDVSSLMPYGMSASSGGKDSISTIIQISVHESDAKLKWVSVVSKDKAAD